MNYIKLIMALALIACLLPMPYGYYLFVRFISMAVFTFFSFHYYKNNKTTLAFTFGTLALLFQPFFKFFLGRFGWQIVDIIVAIFLIVLFLKNKENK